MASFERRCSAIDVAKSWVTAGGGGPDVQATARVRATPTSAGLKAGLVAFVDLGRFHIVMRALSQEQPVSRYAW
jgi:hypothetical protein